MPNATTLYAVDLPRVAAAVGSGDAELTARLKRSRRTTDDDGREIDETAGPRMLIRADSSIEVNGGPVAWEDLPGRLLDPEWRGTYLYWFHQDGRRTGRFSEPGSFLQALMQAVPTLGLQFSCLTNCSSEASLRGTGACYEISEDQAIEGLIGGTYTRPDSAHMYYRALEWLCEDIGTFLESFEGEPLAKIGLDAKLARRRTPVELPKSTDFPIVGYLTADEVTAELERLTATAGRGPGLFGRLLGRGAGLEEEREALVECLRRTAEGNQGILFFEG
jgi:hypothetical protein